MGLSLKDLSKLAAMSVTHFTRQFRAEKGMSPHQYVVRRRIERAKYLLGYTQEPIAKIAHGCGFTHQEHLSGMFRRHVGETQARYRRRQRGAATRRGPTRLISRAEAGLVGNEGVGTYRSGGV